VVHDATRAASLDVAVQAGCTPARCWRASNGPENVADLSRLM